jgi:hypothetical protein
MAWSLPEGAVLGLLGHRLEPVEASSPLPDASAFDEAVLFDVLDLWDSAGILAPGGRKVLLYAPDEAGPWLDARVVEAYALQAQVGGDTGERIASFLEGELAEGAGRVVLVDARAPTLDPSYLVAAFVALERRDVVLGPATDGGCYLVGCRGAVPPVFEGIDWGNADALSRLIERLEGVKCSVAVLPPWYRVSTDEDRRVLRGHLRAMRRAGMDPLPARTEAWLERHPDPRPSPAAP